MYKNFFWIALSLGSSSNQLFSFENIFTASIYTTTIDKKLSPKKFDFSLPYITKYSTYVAAFNHFRNQFPNNAQQNIFSSTSKLFQENKNITPKDANQLVKKFEKLLKAYDAKKIEKITTRLTKKSATFDETIRLIHFAKMLMLPEQFIILLVAPIIKNWDNKAFVLMEDKKFESNFDTLVHMFKPNSMFSITHPLKLKMEESLESKKNPFISASWSPDSQKILITRQNNSIVIWNPSTRKAFALPACTKNIDLASWSPDSAKIVYPINQNKAAIWDVINNTFIGFLKEHSDEVTSAKWSPDGTRIITTSADKSAKIWNTQTGKCIYTLTGHTDEVNFANWSPDNTKIITVSNDKTAKIWDSTNGQCLHTIEGYTTQIQSALWDKDSKKILLTAKYDTTAKIWSALSGECLLNLDDHTEDITTASWSPKSTKVLTTSLDATCKIWDAETGYCLQTLKKHDITVNSADWSPDEKNIITTSEDQTIKIWDATTGKNLTNFTDASQKIAKWSPDGNALITAIDGDKNINLWMYWKKTDSVTAAEYIINELSKNESLTFYTPKDGALLDLMIKKLNKRFPQEQPLIKTMPREHAVDRNIFKVIFGSQYAQI